MILIDKKFTIKPSSIHGLGLFSNSLILQNCIALQAPVIIIPIGVYCPKILLPYTFTFEGKMMISFTYISYINSSNTPNVVSSYDNNNKIITLTTLSEIKPGDEVTLKYL